MDGMEGKTSKTKYLLHLLNENSKSCLPMVKENVEMLTKENNVKIKGN